MAEKDRWGVVYSSRARAFKSGKRWQKIRQYIESKGVQYDFVQSESSDSVERLSTMMCNNGYHTLIIVGGDGALNDAINSVIACKDSLPEDFALGIIPNGIGNDFARFWDFDEKDYRNTIDRLVERRTRKIDVAKANFMVNDQPSERYFLNCMNIGLGARLIKTTSDSQRFTGSRRFSVITLLISNLLHRSSFPYVMEIDSESISGQYMSVCIGNCHSYGQTPNSVPYNGMLDISVITRPEWWQLFEGFWLLGKGRFLNYKNVHPYRANSIHITSCGSASYSFDGHAFSSKQCTPITVSVLPETINFII